MKTLLCLLLVSVGLPAVAQTTFWRGTNSTCGILLVAFGPVTAPTNYPNAHVLLTVKGRHQRQPAEVYIGGSGWLTLDYGKDVYPDRIRQFQVTFHGAASMLCRYEDGETFTLFRYEP